MMKRMPKIHYFVEGETEKKFVDVLKSELEYIVSGKVTVFNVLQREIPTAKIMSLSVGTKVVLIFDTDISDQKLIECLCQNVKSLKSVLKIQNTDIILVPQVENLEDEVVRSCDILKAQDLIGVETVGEFKAKVANSITVKNLKKYLEAKKFDFSKFWTTTPRQGIYQKICNNSEEIRLKGIRKS